MKFSQWLLHEEKSDKDFDGLFTDMFAARDHAHALHLSTKSYAQHKALGGFYEKLLDLVDQIIEAYQGKNGLINVQKINHDKFASDPVKFVSDFGDLVKKSREMFEDEHLKNLVDEISALTYQTLYKLKFLK
jgi:hypothetical protein